MIKLLRYWWNYNMDRLRDDKSTSFLFKIMALLYLPILIALILKAGMKEDLELNKQRRKKFWDDYKGESL